MIKAGRDLAAVVAAYRQNVAADAEKRRRFIQEQVAAAGSNGVVVGISGGIDSAVTAALCGQALGSDRVLGVWIGAQSAAVHLQDSRELAAKIGFKLVEINLDQVTGMLLVAIRSGLVAAGLPAEPFSQKMAGNTKARERMAVLYALGNELGYLVAGTSNYTEIYLGYETKGGDQVCDFNPIYSLVKAQVQVLATYLGVPEAILTKAPSADLWEGQTDEGEMGFTYAAADTFILTGQGDPAVVAAVTRLHRASAHKRRLAQGI
ncbi:MAG: NAD(+) synthase [Heliobacteriaceae bacterium]|nr:NAD(+) synthase [Heliobacteriaceae bacterium]